MDDFIKTWTIEYANEIVDTEGMEDGVYRLETLMSNNDNGIDFEWIRAIIIDGGRAVPMTHKKDKVWYRKGETSWTDKVLEKPYTKEDRDNDILYKLVDKKEQENGQEANTKSGTTTGE